MSTWISDRRAALAGLAALALLGGCLATGPFSYSSRVPEKIAVAGGAVVVAGPPGYCVDTRATRDRGGTAFALLASCAAISRNPNAPQPYAPAVLTASVTTQAAGEVPVARQTTRLKSFFASPEGRAALARDGNPDTVTVVRTFTRDAAFIIHARHKDAGDGSTLNADQWRAIFNVGGHIVSASVMGLNDRPLTDDAGMATLWEFATRISRESRDAAKAREDEAAAEG